MAQISQGLTFTGSLSNISAYKRRGSDKIILRTKGGASKKKIKTSPSFEKTRKINSEFGGRATATKWIRTALNPLLSMADYNIAGPLNALLKPIQTMDTVNAYGKRSILITKQPDLLQGFQLNQRNTLDHIVRSPVTCTLSKKEGTAQIEIPSLVPGINFVVPGRCSFFAFTIVSAILPELVYNEHGYRPAKKQETIYPVIHQTDWQLVSKGLNAQTIELGMNTKLPDQSFCMVLSVGIMFGNPGMQKVEQVKHAGA